jgi:hypothetical protein
MWVGEAPAWAQGFDYASNWSVFSVNFTFHTLILAWSAKNEKPTVGF